MRKKVSIIGLLVILSTIVWAVVQNNTFDKVSVPNIETKAGQVVTIPVSAVTSNAYYGGFQMNIHLPQGVTPVVDKRGKVIVTQNEDRLYGFTFTLEYKQETSTLMVVAVSLGGDVIEGNEGELFSFQVNVPEGISGGTYTYSIDNIVFSTNSLAPEGAQGYNPDNVKAEFTIADVANTQELLNQIQEAQKVYDALNHKNSNAALTLKGLIDDLTVAAQGEMTSDTMWGYIDSLWSAVNIANTVESYFNTLADNIANLQSNINAHSEADSTALANANAVLAQAQEVLNGTTIDQTTLRQLVNAISSAIDTLGELYLTINVETPGTLGDIFWEKGVAQEDVMGITVKGSINSDDIYFVKDNLWNVKSVNLLETDLTELPSEAFYYKDQLQSIVLPQNLEIIGYNAFYCCYSLSAVTFPSALKRIDNYAFYNCNALTSIELPEGLTTLNYRAFYYCTNLASVVLPSTVNYIDRAFYGCQNLRSLTCKAIVPPSADNGQILGGWEGNCTLIVPTLVVDAYRTPYPWNYFSTIVAGDFPVESLTITNDLTLNSEEPMVAELKSLNVGMLDRGNNYGTWNASRYDFGSLQINGSGSIVLQNFEMALDPLSQYRFKNYGYNNKRASAVLINDAEMSAENVKLNIRLQANRWHFICLPFDVKVGDIAWTNAEQPYAIYKYDGKLRAEQKFDETWVRQTADSTLRAGEGYIWQVASDYNNSNDYDIISCVVTAKTNQNNIFINEDYVMKLNEFIGEFDQDRSWNLVGNPYPAYFAARAMDTTTPFTIWDVVNQTYDAWSPVDDDYVFAPGEAFFIQRPLDQPSIGFVKEGRQTTPESLGNFYFNNARQSDMTAKRHVFNLTIKGNEQTDRTRFVINENAQLTYEMERDASKFAAMTADALQLFTIEQGVRMAINERPLSSGEVKLGVTIGKKGSYTINVDTKSTTEVYLIDRLTGTEILIGEEGYTFESEAGTYADRFMVRLGIGETTGIETVDLSKQADGDYFNLNGVRVDKPQKGLYIKNGKKVVVK